MVDETLCPADPALGFKPVAMPAVNPPLLFVIVDTEEEFDWNAGFSRASTSVRAIAHIDRLQRVLAGYRIRPTYVVDFPIASQRDGYMPVKDIVAGGLARVGAHLHPWVNPPFVEEVNARNSYGCALDAALEMEKMRILQAEIASHFDILPTVYKAGRYGFGRSTVAALEGLNFMVDLSVNPHMNYSSDGGPSFEAFDTRPFFFGGERRLLEIPCSTDYTGISRQHAPRLHRLISHPRVRRAHLVGVMSRLGIVNKVNLSPETSTLGELKAVTRRLFRSGIRTFSLTLHSPSVKPGCTPYVRTASELGQFLDRIAAYCDFFLGTLGGVPSTPEEFRKSLDSGLYRHN
jgi:hypothetical protein